MIELTRKSGISSTNEKRFKLKTSIAKNYGS
jgi:hypothetical protein